MFKIYNCTLADTKALTTQSYAMRTNILVLWHALQLVQNMTHPTLQLGHHPEQQQLYISCLWRNPGVGKLALGVFGNGAE